MEPRKPSTWLSELINVREHWPSLKDLKPDLICTEQSVLKDVYSTHAPTLRSLELKDITLDSDSKDSSLSQESWLDGRLEAVNDSWITHGVEYQKSRDASFVVNATGECLRDQIKRFVIKGGTCALRRPNEDERNTYGDYLWKYAL